jgi:hypothetical protein
LTTAAVAARVFVVKERVWLRFLKAWVAGRLRSMVKDVSVVSEEGGSEKKITGGNAITSSREAEGARRKNTLPMD